MNDFQKRKVHVANFATEKRIRQESFFDPEITTCEAEVPDGEPPNANAGSPGALAGLENALSEPEIGFSSSPRAFSGSENRGGEAENADGGSPFAPSRSENARGADARFHGSTTAQHGR